MQANNSGVYIRKNVDGVHSDIWVDGVSPETGMPAQQAVASQTSSFSVTGSDADDIVTIDFSNGNPLPAGGLLFDGKAGVNRVRIIGSNQNDSIALASGGISVSGSGFGGASISAAKAAILQFPGGSGGNDALNVNGGTWQIDADTPTGTPNVSVAVAAGATATFSGNQHLANLTVNGGTAKIVTSSRKTVFAAGLTMAGGGLLDIGNNFLMVDNVQTPAARVRQYLINGYNNGGWNGVGGITSTTAAVSGLALGYADKRGAGLNQVLVAQTVYGDANLDGTVDVGDFGKMSANFGGSAAGSWEQGDFNYDGQVDIGDFGKLSANFGSFAPIAGVEAAPPPLPPPAADTLAPPAESSASVVNFAPVTIGNSAAAATPSAGQAVTTGGDPVNAWQSPPPTVALRGVGAMGMTARPGKRGGKKVMVDVGDVVVQPALATRKVFATGKRKRLDWLDRDR